MTTANEVDPFQEVYWNLLQTLAWIERRDRDLVAIYSDRITDHGRYESEVKFPDGRTGLAEIPTKRPTLRRLALLAASDGPGLFSPEHAEQVLLRSIAAKKLGAQGRVNGRGQHTDIPPISAERLKIFESDKWSAYLDGDGTWTDIRFERAQVLAIWPPQSTHNHFIPRGYQSIREVVMKIGEELYTGEWRPTVETEMEAEEARAGIADNSFQKQLRRIQIHGQREKERLAWEEARRQFYGIPPNHTDTRQAYVLQDNGLVAPLPAHVWGDDVEFQNMKLARGFINYRAPSGPALIGRVIVPIDGAAAAPIAQKLQANAIHEVNAVRRDVAKRRRLNRDHSQRLFEKAAWPLIQALAWIAWRNPALLEKPWKLARLYKGNPKLKCRHPREELLRALQAGKILAIRDNQRITREFWFGKTPYVIERESVFFDRSEVLALWGIEGKSRGRRNLPSDAVQVRGQFPPAAFEAEWWNGVQVVGWYLFGTADIVPLLTNGDARPLAELIETNRPVLRHRFPVGHPKDQALDALEAAMWADKVAWTYSQDGKTITGDTERASRIKLNTHAALGLIAHPQRDGTRVPDLGESTALKDLRFRRGDILALWRFLINREAGPDVTQTAVVQWIENHYAKNEGEVRRQDAERIYREALSTKKLSATGVKAGGDGESESYDDIPPNFWKNAVIDRLDAYAPVVGTGDWPASKTGWRSILLSRETVLTLWPDPAARTQSTEANVAAQSAMRGAASNAATIDASVRKPRARDSEEDALLRNKIQGVLTAAKAIDAGRGIELRPLAAEVSSQQKHQDYDQETVRKILAGTYPAQKRLGIRGLR